MSAKDLVIEYSKSARAGCRVCKEKIGKDELRIGTQQETPDSHDFMTLWRHLKCFSVARKWKNIEYDEINGYNDLKREDQQLVEIHFTSQKDGKKIKKSELLQQEETEQDSSKFKGYTEDQYKTFCNNKIVCMTKSNKALSDILRVNNQKCAGQKSDLVERVADGMTLGQIPQCAKCGGGKLKFLAKEGIYKCPGYMEDDAFTYCNKRWEMHEIEREQWIDV